MELSRTSLARFFLARLTAEDSAEADRVVAAEVLSCMNARSAVLSVRDTRSTGSEAARTALSFVRSEASDADSNAQADEGADG